MSGPWEKYQAGTGVSAAAGPWAKFQQPEKRDYTPSSIGGVEVPLLDRFNTFVNSAVDQIPVVGPALSDFGAGVDAAFASMVEGKPVTKEERKAINAAQEEEFPIENIGGRITGVVAPFALAAPYATASKLLGMSGNIGSRMGFGALSGGAISGADTKARGGSWEDAGVNALLGAGVGAMFPVGEKLVKMGWDAIRGAPVIARPAQKVAQGAVADKLTPNDLDAMLAALGDDAVLADLGPNLQAHAGALATMPGEAKSVIADKLVPRTAGKNARIIDDTDAILGPAPVPSKVEAGIRDGQRTLGPSYGEAFRGARAVDTTAIANDLDSAIVNMRGDAQKALKHVRQMLDVYGEPGTLDPNPGTLFQTRQAIDGILSTEANPKVIAALTQVRQQVDSVLADAVPGIKQVDAQFAELARQNEGLQLGAKALNSGKTAVRPAEMADEVAAGVQPEGLFIGPSGKTFRVSQGARAEIDRLIGTTANDLVALKQALKGDGSWNRQKLTQLFGNDKADALLDVLEREMKFQGTYDAAFGNSKTAATTAAQKLYSPEVTGLPTSSTMTGILANLATRATGAAASAAKTSGNAEAARLLMSGKEASPVLRAAIAQAIREAKPSLLAPGAAAVGVTTPKKKPIEIMVRGGNPALGR